VGGRGRRGVWRDIQTVTGRKGFFHGTEEKNAKLGEEEPGKARKLRGVLESRPAPAQKKRGGENH